MKSVINGLDQFVDVSDAPNLNLTSQITIDAWVFPTALVGQNDIIINKETAPPNFAIQYELSIRGPAFPNSPVPVGTFMFFFGGVQGLPNDGAGWVSGGGQVSLNTWSHVALSFDGSSAKAYINGVLTRTVTGLSGSIDVTSGPLRIGTRSDLIDPFNGFIDEVEIYDRALSATEIQAIFLADSEGKCKVLTISIDIKPGSDPNSINPRSRGVIPVAILTTDTFDATTVEPSTVLFGPTGTEAAPVHVALEDVDLDGDIGMILHFNTQETGIVCGDTSASLTGKTFGGLTIEGSDSVETVRCK